MPDRTELTRKRRPRRKPAAEIELKLSGDPKALRAIFQSPALRGRSPGRAKSMQLDAVYYDTADLRLRRAGLSLRVRQNGRRFEQTLKADDGAGGATLTRGEWEMPLASGEPDLAAMPEDAEARLTQVLGDGPLRPLFSTRVRRQVRRLEASQATGDAALVEAALDLGTIEAAGCSLPIAELELELLDGAPAALFALARELDRLTPLHVETASKAARGYALAAGEPPAWHKAGPIGLDGDATVDHALAAILRACLGHWLANEAAALDGRDPEGIHQLRVAIRRLRSAFAVLGRSIDPAALAWLKPAAKRIVTSLGAARDWDVFLGELVAPVRAARPDDPDLALLGAAAGDARAEGYATARAAIFDRGYTGFVLRLGEWIERRGWRGERTDAEAASRFDEPARALADRLLAHRQRKAHKRGRDVAALSPAERHQLRIVLKKLRYAAEFFASLYPEKPTQKYVQALKRLQDDLGHLNDVAVAERLLDHLLARTEAGDRREAMQRAAGLVLGWHSHGARAVEQRILERWTAFVEQKPFWG